MRFGLFFTALIAITPAAAQIKSGKSTTEPGITRRLLVDQPTVHTFRTSYAPGAMESHGPHPYDVVLVPLNSGTIHLNVAGQPDPLWRPGEAIFIKRGTDHQLVNVGKTAIEFVSVRIP
jgi:quercetin dioxygenase-like cupin family protein